jgi:hypothetical protein
MYNAMPAMHQIILGINNDRLAHKTRQHAADNTFTWTVTLEKVQKDFRQKYAATKKTTTPGKTQPMLLFTTPSTKKSIAKKLKKVCSFCGKQEHI